MNPNRPQIDPKTTPNRAQEAPGSTPGATSGARAPKAVKKNPKQSRKSPKVAPKSRRNLRESPKKPPGAEEHGKMTAAGATRERRKCRGGRVSRRFRSRALPGTISGALGLPRERFGPPRDPQISCFRLGKTTIFTFSPYFRFCRENREKKRCARTRFGPRWASWAPSGFPGAPPGGPKRRPEWTGDAPGRP